MKTTLQELKEYFEQRQLKKLEHIYTEEEVMRFAINICNNEIIKEKEQLLLFAYTQLQNLDNNEDVIYKKVPEEIYKELFNEEIKEFKEEIEHKLNNSTQAVKEEIEIVNISNNFNVILIPKKDAVELVKIKNYFGENDKTMLEQKAYDVLNRLIKQF